MEQPTDIPAAADVAKNASFACTRQSSTRWTPTTDQIRILKDLYYNNGVRSPTADQIQRISAKLRQYGKIEGKNVFYWFQNHKARERQKKRFTADASAGNIPMLHKPPAPAWTTSDYDHHLSPIYNKFPNINPGNFASSSNSGGYVNYGYGSVERSFRECTINPNGGQNYAWIGVDPYCGPYPNFRKYGVEKTLEMEELEEEEAAAPEIEMETLPLFPMHGDVMRDDFNGWHRRVEERFAAAGSRASLELTLNSYAAAAGFPSS